MRGQGLHIDAVEVDAAEMDQRRSRESHTASALQSRARRRQGGARVPVSSQHRRSEDMPAT